MLYSLSYSGFSVTDGGMSDRIGSRTVLAVVYEDGVAVFGLMLAGIGGGYIWEHFGANYAVIVGGGFVIVGIAVLSTIMVNGK